MKRILAVLLAITLVGSTTILPTISAAQSQIASSNNASPDAFSRNIQTLENALNNKVYKKNFKDVIGNYYRDNETDVTPAVEYFEDRINGWFSSIGVIEAIHNRCPKLDDEPDTTSFDAVDTHYNNLTKIYKNLKANNHLYPNNTLITVSNPEQDLINMMKQFSELNKELNDYLEVAKTHLGKLDDSEDTEESDERDISSSEIENTAESLKEKQDAANQAFLDEALKLMSEDEKDAFTIASNKYMTQTELDAFKWNLIISQFAVPYIDSLQDTLQQPVFADMASQGLTISSNPYLEAIKLAEDKVTGGLNSELFKDGKLVISEKYNMTDIISTLNEENEISYSPLYTSEGKEASISDLFNSNALYVHDKITYYGTGVLDNDSLVKTMQNFQEKYADADMNEAIDMIQGFSEVKDIKIPVWIQTDGVLLYNMLFVADAIRITGAGTYKNFINDIGDNRLFVDRWGNICSKLNSDKYVIVYPSYANPIYTSQGTSKDDLVGLGYGSVPDNPSLNMFSDDTRVGGIVTPNQVALTQEEVIQRIYQGETITKNTTLKDSSEVFNDTYLGLNRPVWTSSVLDLRDCPINTLDFSRVGTANSGIMGTMPYILLVDNTKNFFINKTILSSYSHDTAYSSGQGAYGCLRDRISSYAEISGMADYKYNSAATFGNSLIFDKYNVHSVGTDLRKYDYSTAAVTGGINYYKSDETSEKDREYLLYPIFAKDSEKKPIGFGVDDLTLALDTFTKSNGVVSKSNKLLDYNKTGSFRFLPNNSNIGMVSTDAKKTTMYPFMVNHSYRKGLYTDSTTRIGAVSLFNFDFTLKGFSSPFNVENLFIKDDKDNKLEESYLRKTYPVELVWNAMYLDSDNYKTYAILNYDASVLPDNVSANLMCAKATSKGDTTLKNASSFERYCAIPIMDSTIDLTDVWSIWDNVNGGEDREMNIKSDSDRQKNTKIFSNCFSKYEGFMNPTPISIAAKGESANTNTSVLRYYLKDQRVSDVLQNYPTEDVTLMAYVWLNYYIPKTSISTKVPIMSGEVVTDGTLESETAAEAIVTTATTDVTTAETIAEPTTEDIQLAGKKIIPDDAVITPYNFITDDSNLLLLYTNENSTDRGDYMYSTESVNSWGEFKSAKVTSYVSVAQVNIPTLLLAVNRNTNGDNLTYLRNKVDEITVDTDEILSFFLAFQKTPGTALYNIFQGLLQKIHYSVSAGAFGSIYDNSWITEKILEPVYLPIIIALIIGSIGLSIFINCMKTLMRKDATLISTIKSIPRMTFFGTLPILVVYSLNWSLNLIATVTTKSIASKMSMVKIEEIVKSQESLNLNFETQYQIFRDQFEGIEDNFTALSVDFLYGTDASGEDIIKQKTIKELYDEVSYSTLLANQNASALVVEKQLDAYNVSFEDNKQTRKLTSDNSLSELYTTYSAGKTPFYYSYEKFVPVNYPKYSESVFYYFYDWIKYQYLRYWATHDSSSTEVFSSLAKNFTMPEIASDFEKLRLELHEKNPDFKLKTESWSSYVSRMFEAEQSLFKKAYGGVNYMYNDARYVYQDTYDKDGNVINEDEINDLFGLSYLFHMTEIFPSSIEEAKKIYYPTLPNYYFSGVKTAVTENKNTFNGWAESARSTFDTSFGNYIDYTNMLAINDTPYDNFMPLSYIATGANWNYYKQSAKLHDGNSDFLKDYTFTPEYLIMNDVGGVYSSYNTEEYITSQVDKEVNILDELRKLIRYNGSMREREIAPFMSISTMDALHGNENTALAKFALNMSFYYPMSDIIAQAPSLERLRENYVDNDFYDVQNRHNNCRAPYTIYGSKGVLKRSVYNDKTGEFGDYSMTSLEKSLVSLNEKIYDDAQDICKFMTGDMRDSTMIFALALAATFEFNSTFGGGKALPTSLNTSTVTLDDIMRISFAENIDQIVKQRNVIYMMFDSPGGIFVGLPVVLAESILWVALLIRFALLVLLLIGAVIVGLGNMLFPKKANKQLLIGLASQYMAVLLGQVFLLGSTTLLFSVFEFNDVWFTNIIKALFLLICYYFVLIMHLKMMTALITNFREFGGTVISHAIQSAQSRIESVMSASANVMAGNVNINMNAPQQKANTVTPLGVSRKHIQSNIEDMEQPETKRPTLGRRDLTSLETRMNNTKTTRLKRTTGRFYNKGRVDISSLNHDQKTVYLCKVAANKITDTPLEAKKAQKMIYRYMATGKIKDNTNEPMLKSLASSIRTAASDSTVVDPVKFVANDAKRANENMTLTL